jgi:hypothetical protein
MANLTVLGADSETRKLRADAQATSARHEVPNQDPGPNLDSEHSVPRMRVAAEGRDHFGTWPGGPAGL